ncbi:MAG: hypothetical protein HQL90_05555 [Magnetococcales bacterium]|nr:hypothetical protein [Magnetococcales bacterium]
MYSPVTYKSGGFALLLGLSALCFQPATALAAIWYNGEFSADIIITDPQTPEGKVQGTFYVGKDRFRAEGVHQGKRKALIVHPQEHKVWMLFPDEKSYYAGPGSAPIPPRPDVERLPGDNDGPCKQDKAIACKRLGTETLHGVETEKWEVTLTPPPPPAGQPAGATAPQAAVQKATVWADPARRIIIRQQPEVGPAMERILTGTEKVADRLTEKWTITHTFQGNTQQSTRWIDSKLRVPVREEEEGKLLMELVNLQEKPQPASLFELPKDYKEIQPPAPPTAQQAPATPPAGSAPVPAQPGKLQYR